MAKRKTKPSQRNRVHGQSMESSNIAIKGQAKIEEELKTIDILYQQGKITDCLAIIQMAIKAYPKQASLHERAGDFSMLLGDEQAALGYYQQTLKYTPNNYKVSYNTGCLYKKNRCFKEAEIAFKNAIKYCPDFVEAYNNLGNLLKGQNRYQEAEQAYQQVLKYKPDFIDAQYNLGILYKESKRYKEAEVCFRSVLKLRVDYHEAYFNLGELLQIKKRFEEAILSFQSALKYNPKNTQTYSNLGFLFQEIKCYKEAENYYYLALKSRENFADPYNNLGYLFHLQKRYKEAESAYNSALKLRPDYPEVYSNQGNLFLEQRRYKEAEASYQMALTLKPGYAMAYSNQGNLFLEQKRYVEAESSYKNALLFRSDYTDVYSNLGFLYQEQKRYKEAEESYRMALIICSDNVDACFNLSELLLTLGRFKEGWKAYESRYHSKKDNRQSHLPELSIPMWQGEALADKTLLIWPEQGVGDEIMFASCLNELKCSNGRVIVACDPRLQSFFKRSFPFLEVVEKDPENSYKQFAGDLNFHCGIGSLAKYFRNSFNDFEQVTGYLKADEALLDKWKQRYNQLKYPFNIGISWRGGGDNKRQQQNKSIGLDQWLPILKNEANFINLQYGNHQEEINRFEKEMGISLYDWDDADPLIDLDNFAAQVKALDLVISISNATVHFSGALGINTIVLLSYNQSWRWFEGKHDSPWYPGVMKLCRQKKGDEWGDVICHVGRLLDENLSCYGKK